MTEDGKPHEPSRDMLEMWAKLNEKVKDIERRRVIEHQRKVENDAIEYFQKKWGIAVKGEER